MLLVAASVIISLLLLQHDEPIAPVALSTKNKHIAPTGQQSRA
jgi:hypothetical protein